MEEWKRAVDAKEEVAVLSTDMSKAFDSLHPPLMLSKLRAYGFSEHALELLRSYFTERKNRERIGMEATSKWKDVNRVCPQGSTFGPLLWNIFQNNLTFNVSNCPSSMYADDHQLYAIGRRIQDVERTINDEGNNVSSWYSTNALQGNFSKYQAVRFGPRSTDRDIDIVITDTSVESYPILELLGVSIVITHPLIFA